MSKWLSGRLGARLSLNLQGKDPEFLCIGAQKAGTEWLYQQLSGHPDVWTPPIRELHYFDDPKRFYNKFNFRVLCSPGFLQRLARNRRLPPTLQDIFFYKAARNIRHSLDANPDAYTKLFCAEASLLTGDITPAYSTLEKSSIEKIATRFPRIKIIFLIRNPIDRFWSQLCMEIRKGRIDASIVQDPNKVLDIAACAPVRLRSFPAITYEKWSSCFQENRIGVFFFDRLRSDPLAFRRDVFEFLSLDPAKCLADATHNRKSGYPKIQMQEPVKKALTDLFAEEIQQCVLRFGDPCASWRF